MAKFVGIPSITEGLSPWQKMYMDASKENIELLTNQRGNGSKAAILKGDISVAYLAAASGVDLATLTTEVNGVISQFNLLLSSMRN